MTQACGPHQASLHCIAYGVEFRLAANSTALLDAMRAALPLGTQTLPAPLDATPLCTLQALDTPPQYRLVIDDRIVEESTNLAHVQMQLARELMLLVANHAPDQVFLHAGVVGWQGKALILPGTSFAGKTTLVAALVRAGATYYSDEYAVLDANGHVHPYARDLQMRVPGKAEQTPTSVKTLNGHSGTSPLPVSHVVFAEYMHLGRWSPQPVSAGMAVLEMLRHTIPVQRTPARVMATFATMMRTATALRSARDEAHDAAKWLLDAMTLNACEARP